MPSPSPFHARLAPLCTSYKWKDWAGQCAVRSFEASHDREYAALRYAAGLIDVSPLYKYDVRGPQAAALLSRMLVRDVSRLGCGRIAYCCWCDDAGKVIDDGTLTRLGEAHFRLTAAEPTYRWLARLGRGYDAAIVDVSAALAALALQGPTSRDILRAACETDVAALGFFRGVGTRLRGIDVWLSRTGYTGDLGYEIWVDAPRALELWDALGEVGRAYGMLPVGLDALDVARIEAGFIMLDVDYHGAHSVVEERRKSSPFELGLGWTVELEREPFVGQAALAREAARGRRVALVGLETGWEAFEALYARYDRPPSLAATASREPLPVYRDGRQVGRATSHTWSPILKRGIALASVDADCAAEGSELELEHTVEYARERLPARVAATPFFDPARKRRP